MRDARPCRPLNDLAHAVLRFLAVGPHMFSGLRCSSTFSFAKKPSSTTMSATGRFSARAFAAAAVQFL
eukprot:CAMPEP_0176214198 /NCGR_PEP_ID=MMETSP0121_2-20121125/16047_1 /TAXON_ID=160619 /ORGANISM="Kryptoperidinium foliaceum, Strain CCMP 1326" /LENGTH=67 /DNA_ID=CAMNT_0017553277 /DNA_START=256 /DNA_END=459 /DNA_ORIENTATION=-